MEYKDRIKAARKHAKLTQVELAKLVGIDQTSISDLERGKSQSSSYNARIASACGINPLWLEEGSGDMVEIDFTRAHDLLHATWDQMEDLEVERSGQGLERELEPGIPVTDEKAEAAAKVMEMLRKHGKGLSGLAQQRIALAVAESLTEPKLIVQKPNNVIAADFSRPARLTDGDILIPQYDIRASMGHGQVPADYSEFVRNVVVSGPQLEKLGLEYTSPANLSIITGWGQSMAGTIEDKDPVIVDRGVTEFTGDGIYVLTWDDHLYIKRLQKADADHFDLISDNPKHKDRVVNVDEVVIHARVLYVWRGMKL